MDESARGLLVSEARELLADMERSLLEMEAEGPSAERINAVFRAAHTIKGSAGLFGLDLIVSFTQIVESVLDRVRNGSLDIGVERVSTLLRCCDYVGQLVGAIEQHNEHADPAPAMRAELLDGLKGLLGEDAKLALRHTDVRDAAAPRAAGKRWHLSLRFGTEVMHKGMDPLSFILYLRELGAIVYLHTLTDALPPTAEMDPELCYLGYEIGLETTADRKTLDEAFAFVRDDSTVRILSPESNVADYIQVIKGLRGSQARLGELLVASGALSPTDLETMLSRQAQHTEGPRPKLGEVLVHEQLVAEPVVAAALNRQKQTEERRASEQRVVKVDASKLDQLINLVGELVIASEGARLMATRAQTGDLVDTLAKVGQIVEQVRDRALGMRMVPIGEVFQRFPRVVRDVSRELGKQIDLVITGAETELDKSMVDKLSDPLLHLVRNAIDHGIEPMHVREEAGKHVSGRLRLHAFHESGCIVIEITDDGRGLDRRAILAKAIEKGLVAPDAALSDSEIEQLLFLPGFSTAAEVTSLSGRGVGMDVVKRSVEALRGEIEIESVRGEGTCFRIRLPLTLAIIEGFQVAVDDTIFVIPLETVVECVDMTQAHGMQRLLSLRGEPLPYLRLRDVFHLGPRKSGRESVVVVGHAQHRVGLVVDRLLGDAQAVIKPLGQLFRGLKAVSSSTILGDGTVALILDVPTLVARAGESHANATPAHALLH